jgi:hypothetical protein
VAAADDPLVRQTWAETWRLRRELDELLGRLEAGPPGGNGKASPRAAFRAGPQEPPAVPEGPGLWMPDVTAEGRER